MTNMKVERVSFKQVYDLVFRSRNARLNSTAYVLSFENWLKAGIAFNTRGFELSTRKISYFAMLYSILQESKTLGPSRIKEEESLFREALRRYYEDIFDIYQDHLSSKQEEVSRKKQKAVPNFGELLILPSFDDAKVLYDVFKAERYSWDSYECMDSDAFLEAANSAYLTEGSGIFRCMSLMFDYGLGKGEQGVLLEVDLWD